jgi:hypothetical protein
MNRHRVKKGPAPKPITLTDDERARLTELTRRSKSANAVARRARIILAAADGLGNTDAKVELVITKTLEETPRGETHWSRRSMVRAVGLSPDSIGRIWRAFGLQPHRSETFKLSPDPQFIDKVRDIVGLYLSPPTNSVVLCVDEKSQIQALERTQPLLPLRPGQVERRSHDYERHGTTTLFAALNTATGEVLRRCERQHTQKEYLRGPGRRDEAEGAAGARGGQRRGGQATPPLQGGR